MDPEEWRADIRAKARADKIRVITIRDGDRAIAARQRSVPKDQEFAELSAALERSEVVRGVAERARALGHEIVRWLGHDDESIAICARCPARLHNPRVFLPGELPPRRGTLPRDLPAPIVNA